MTPPFDTVYAVSPRGRIADMDDMLIIEPPPGLRHSRNRVLPRQHHGLDVHLQSHCPRSPPTTSTTLPAPPIPTLLCRMSSLPYRSTAARTISRQLSDDVTSPMNADALPSCDSDSLQRPPDALLIRINQQNIRPLISEQNSRRLPIPNNIPPPPATPAPPPSR